MRFSAFQGPCGASKAPGPKISAAHHLPLAPPPEERPPLNELLEELLLEELLLEELLLEELLLEELS